MSPEVKEFFDPSTWTLTYVVYDTETKDAVILDPVWNYEPATSTLSTESTDQVLNWAESKGLRVHYILETHAHADHISGAQNLKASLPGALVGIGEKITEVQKTFKNVFSMPFHFATDGSQFDVLLREGTVLNAGSLSIQTISTPGHTPACSTYVIGDAVFTGDALFMPDYGTGRCDFPSGSAEDLYHSVHEKIYSLPDHFRVYVGHDYQPQGRPLLFQSTIGEEKKKNIHLSFGTSESEFVSMRAQRDRNLSAPRLLFPSVQVNIDAGHLPALDETGKRFLKIPLTAEKP